MRSPLVLLLVALACSPPAEREYRQIAPSVPLEYGEQCADARRMARDSVPPAGLVPPAMIDFPMPPLPVPSPVRGQTARIPFRVDSAGHVITPLTITGISDAAYVRAWRATYEKVRFRPAHIGRCAVEGKYLMTYAF